MRRCSSGSDGPNFDHDSNPIGRSCDPPRIAWQFQRADAMILYSENVIYRNKAKCWILRPGNRPTEHASLQKRRWERRKYDPTVSVPILPLDPETEPVINAACRYAGCQ